MGWQKQNSILYLFHIRDKKGGEILNTLKLKGKIAEKGKTQIELAKILNISTQSFNAKLNGRAIFDIEEAKKLIAELQIENIKEIFFD